MTASVKEVTAETVTGHCADRAKGEFDDSLLLILTEKRTHENAVYLKRHIDKSLSITLTVFELTQFLVCKRDERC